MSDSTQGEVYTEFIAVELAKENARRDSLQGRSQWLISSSGLLLTLMTGIAVFLRLSQPQLISGWVRAGYFVSVTAIVAAVAFGIWAGRAFRYLVTDGSTLSAMLDGHWGDDSVDARNQVAKLRVAEIVSLRHGNNLMSRWVLAGQVSQLIFVIGFVISALVTVTTKDGV